MSSFDKVANAAVIVTAVVVIGLNGYHRFIERPKGGSVTDPPRVVGRPLALPASLPLGRSGTIELVVSKGCKYCTASMDLYRRLAAAKPVGACDVKLIAVGPSERDTSGELRDYLHSKGLRVDGVGTMPLADLGVPGTPTIILGDSAKIVRHAWVGQLERNKENEVLSAVQSMCSGL